MKIRVRKLINNETLHPYATVSVIDGVYETLFCTSRSWTFHTQLIKEGFKYSHSSGVDVDIDVELDQVKPTVDLINKTYEKVCQAYKQLEDK